MVDRTFCSLANPAEPLAGTADPVGAWLLLEYRPVWKARVREDNNLAPRTRAWLDDSLARLAALGIRARPQFIRQPESESEQIRMYLALPDRLLRFTSTDYEGLAAIDLGAIASGQIDGGERLTAPHYFVCTNGQRDLCCARYGLPTYAALREQAGARVWQITHLGGHRFAPNVLVLPEGGLYGRVTIDAVPDFVARIEAGERAFPLLRGTSFQPKHVQAAEALLARSDLRLLHVAGDENRARVRFATPEGDVEATVLRDPEGLSVMASCGDAAPEVVHPYRLV